MSIGLDRFKTLNTRFGQAKGDEFLVRAAQKLQQEIGPGGIAARMAGDQFAVLLGNVKGRAEADEIANRIKTKLAEPWRTDKGDVIATTARDRCCVQRNGL